MPFHRVFRVKEGHLVVVLDATQEEMAAAQLASERIHLELDLRLDQPARRHPRTACVTVEISVVDVGRVTPDRASKAKPIDGERTWLWRRRNACDGSPGGTRRRENPGRRLGIPALAGPVHDQRTTIIHVRLGHIASLSTDGGDLRPGVIHFAEFQVRRRALGGIGGVHRYRLHVDRAVFDTHHRGERDRDGSRRRPARRATFEYPDHVSARGPYGGD